MGNHPLKVAVSGAAGYIGSRLGEHLLREGYAVVPLTRTDLAEGAAIRLRHALAGCGAVVNLAGERIDRRWSTSYKQRLYGSRVETTLRLAEAVNAMETPPRVFVSASAVGYYPDEGCYDEYDAVKGHGFLSDLCEAWERAASTVDPRVRLVVTRFGVVLGAGARAFRKMTLPFRMGVAARIGDGRQPFSWIGERDLVRAIAFLLSEESVSGPVNLVSPQRLDNAALTRELARYYGDRVRTTVPRSLFRLLYGEASSVLTSGQCAVPAKLAAAGFVFETPAIGDLLFRLGRAAEPDPDMD